MYASLNYFTISLLYEKEFFLLTKEHVFWKRYDKTPNNAETEKKKF